MNALTEGFKGTGLNGPRGHGFGHAEIKPPISSQSSQDWSSEERSEPEIDMSYLSRMVTYVWE